MSDLHIVQSLLVVEALVILVSVYLMHYYGKRLRSDGVLYCVVVITVTLLVFLWTLAAMCSLVN